MVKKQKPEIELGNYLRSKRKSFDIGTKNNTIDNFIDYPVEEGLLDEGWISHKTLSNIENGYNIPNLITIKNLATAMQIDVTDLIKGIYSHMNL